MGEIVVDCSNGQCDPCDQELITTGNVLANFSNFLGNLSAISIAGGGSVVIFSPLAGPAAPEVAAFGFGAIQFGSILGIGSGVVGIAAGLTQAAGGRPETGLSNAFDAALSISGGALLGRAFDIRFLENGSATERRMAQTLRGPTTLLGVGTDLFLSAAGGVDQAQGCPQ